MKDHASIPRRHYYADFEVKEIAVTGTLLGLVAGLVVGVLIGWWTA